MMYSTKIYLQFTLSILLSLTVFLSPTPLFGQSPYELNWKKELAFSGSGIGTFLLGKHLKTKAPLFTTNELLTLDPNDINAFDRIATNFSSLHAHNASDVFWHGSFALPVLFLTQDATRKNFGKLIAMWGETVVLNAGVTLISKHTFQRPRPFVFDQNAEMERKLVSNAKASFVSGHTSMTAANTFFMAKVFSDYYPDSEWKPIVWGVAATIPAITGYLRVRGGRHYPTDTIAGYALGATIGILVPHLHKRKGKKDQKLHVFGGMNGMLLQYQF